MEQIYYTQCPVGYGLGASNGFQVKRLSKGYPMSGDFRHLGLKAFPGGSRTLAPPALRYRRDGENAEIAWLTPRANEYETERGLWGRPGGHFAHGLRLTLDELNAVRRWPAGLFDSPIWKRTDREPSRGRPPEEVELSPGSLIQLPSFAEVATLAEGIDPDRLARLLTALASVNRDSRTLFLIEEPAKLGPLIALLTFAFPEKLREDLTFSTYHDRPEELPGYRISGTISLTRPNKPAMTAQGIIADLTLGTFEPRIEPTEWARTLAGWLTRHDSVDEADWTITETRASLALKLSSRESAWTDEWLGHLHAFPESQRSRDVPADPEGWKNLASFTKWLGKTGLGEEWVRPRNAKWWLEAANVGKETFEAREALVAHATLRETWRKNSDPSAWGEVIATWFRDADPSERDSSIAAILQSAPKASRPSFATALLQGLTPEGAQTVLDRLRNDPSSDRAMLLPLEASAAVAAILAGGETGNLTAIVESALELPGAVSAVLNVVEAATDTNRELLPIFATSVAPAFDLEASGEGREGLEWALRRGGAAPRWLGPALRPILADTSRQDLWLTLRERTSEDLRPELARTFLAIASDPGLPDETFRWGIEGLVLPLAPRPSHPTWAETYLRRTPSDLDLLRRLAAPEFRKLGILAWINQAKDRGEIPAEQLARIESCLQYARALNSKDPQALLKINVPSVPPAERGMLLGQMLSHVGGERLEGLPFVLDSVRQAWPNAFEPGASGLRLIAAPLAKCLAALATNPASWLARVTRIVERLGVADGTMRGFEPNGLAAEIAAASPRIAGATSDPWVIRKALFADPDAWRILFIDIQRDLADSDIVRVHEVLKRWDDHLPMPSNHPSRFLELFLNSCDSRRLVRAVLAKLPDLKSFPAIPYWDHRRTPGSRNDLRDGFTRTAPFAPLPIGQTFLKSDAIVDRDSDQTTTGISGASMYRLKEWIEGHSKVLMEFDESSPLSLEAEPRKSGQGGEWNAVPPHLSPLGWSRWKTLEALTNFQNAGWDASARWPIVLAWRSSLDLGLLSLDDRHKLVSWLILGLTEAESFQLAPLAAWLFQSGVNDYKRLGNWARELDGLFDIPGELEIHRSRMVGELKSELFRVFSDGKESRKLRSGSHDRS